MWRRLNRLLDVSWLSRSMGFSKPSNDGTPKVWSKGIAIINMRVYREATDSWEELPPQVSTFQGRLR